MKAHILKSVLPMVLGALGASFAILYPTHYSAFCAVGGAGLL